MKICGTPAKKDVGLMRIHAGFITLLVTNTGLLPLARHHQIVPDGKHSRHTVSSKSGHILV